ncbi:MAG: aldehyde:ferredoxin oxidoreductase [Bacteroidetes bacterium GWF2_33_16]|nr:MAG: aldehyde:ferredoxin oxidoreductase [Bacteroidetes bacterium GWE2_32_14]OFY04561.1 MAG: aldehyde:ferredoxin oxidoreductase [Bacteroidetes bacterium GWF2_33_16]
MMLNDSLSKVLYIDLTKKKFETKDRRDLFEKYLGGTGVATELLLEECPEGIDPFHPDAPIIFAVGPLTGVFPLASKTTAMFKSPHTGDLGESHAGGRSAIAIRMAGYGAIVIKGASELPLYLSIHDGKVQFKNATTLWGMKDGSIPARVMRQKEKGDGLRAIFRIGTAGENLVTYSNVTTETYRHFGRLGLGAVFGSKKLKGMVISGKKAIEVNDKKAYRVLYDHIYKAATESPVMKKYHDVGTAINIKALNFVKALPVKNLQFSSSESIEMVTGESIAQHHLARRVACAHCPVACIHLAFLREPYDDDPYFYKTSPVCYDFELIYSLGTMVGIDDPTNLLKLIDIVEQVGVDAMSMGVILAWMTEMYDRKKITIEDLDGIDIKWGDADAYIELVKRIVKPSTSFLKACARGVDYAANQYGGKEFAMQFGKNEMAGYHTGPAGYLGFLLGARHSHLDNGGYSIDQKDLVKIDLTPSQVVDKLLEEEAIRQILSSVAVCFFARGIYDLKLVSDAVKLLGFDFSDEQLLEMGKKIHLNKYKFKMREGFRFEKLDIPERIYETNDPTGKITKKFITEGINYAKSLID